MESGSQTAININDNLQSPDVASLCPTLTKKTRRKTSVLVPLVMARSNYIQGLKIYSCVWEMYRSVFKTHSNPEFLAELITLFATATTSSFANLKNLKIFSQTNIIGYNYGYKLILRKTAFYRLAICKPAL